MEKLLTVKQVAQMLAVSTKTIYQMVSEGTIPYLRLGNIIRFEAEAIESYLQSCRRGSK